MARRSGVGGVANSGECISKYKRLGHCNPAKNRLLDKRCAGTIEPDELSDLETIGLGLEGFTTKISSLVEGKFG